MGAHAAQLRRQMDETGAAMDAALTQHRVSRRCPPCGLSDRGGPCAAGRRPPSGHLR